MDSSQQLQMLTVSNTHLNIISNTISTTTGRQEETQMLTMLNIIRELESNLRDNHLPQMVMKEQVNNNNLANDEKDEK
jgi:hypothetical protein